MKHEKASETLFLSSIPFLKALWELGNPQRQLIQEESVGDVLSEVGGWREGKLPSLSPLLGFPKTGK